MIVKKIKPRIEALLKENAVMSESELNWIFAESENLQEISNIMAACMILHEEGKAKLVQVPYGKGFSYYIKSVDVRKQ